MRLWAIVALVAAIAGPAAVAATTDSAVAKKHGAVCPSSARIAQLPRWRSGGLLRADVNGDRRADAVSIRLDRSAPARCAVYLRVSASGRVHTLGLGRLIASNFGKNEWNAPMPHGHSGLPVVEAIVRLGGHGNFIALGDQEGASNLLVEFVGLSHGKFRTALSLSLGGSVMWVESASCTHRGVLRHWGIGPARGWTKKHPNRWAYSVDTYRRHGRRIDAVAHRTVKGSEQKVTRAAKRAGLGRGLAGCSLARNRNSAFRNFF